MGKHFIDELFGPLSFERRYGQYGLERKEGRIGLNQGQKLSLVNEIDLIEDKDGRTGNTLKPGRKLPVPFLPAFFRDRQWDIYQEQHNVNLGKAVHGYPDHFPIQGFPGGMQSRGVQEENLVIVVVEDPHYPIAGSLGFGSDNWYFLAQKAVHKCRFARIGRTDDCHHSGFDLIS